MSAYDQAFRAVSWCAWLCVLAATTACNLGLPSEGESRTYFVLEDTEPQQTQEQYASEFDLIIRDVDSSSFVNSQRIVFGEDNERGFYQFAFWVETPTRGLTSLLIHRIQGSELFRSVAGEGSGTVGDVQLNTDLLEFYHDTRRKPGQVHVRVRAELIDLRKRSLVSVKTFEAVEPVERYSAQGAVDAFSRATSDVINAIVTWLSEEASAIDVEL